MVRWTESCPLEGLCPECGLKFEWRDVFNEPLVPEWWVERDESRLRFRGARTLLRSLWPFRFWKRIRLEFHGGLRRSVWLLLILLGCFYVSEVVATAATLYNIYVKTSIYSSKIRMGWRAALLPFHSWNRPNTLWLLICAACFPLAAVVLPQTRRRAKVAWSHLARVFVYATSAGLIVQIAASLALSTLLMADSRIAGSGIGSSMQIVTSIPMLFVGNSLLFLAIVVLSWWCACKHYLRLEHAPAVAIALTTIALLAPFTLMVCIETVKRFGFYGTFFQ